MIKPIIVISLADTDKVWDSPHSQLPTYGRPVLTWEDLGDTYCSTTIRYLTATHPGIKIDLIVRSFLYCKCIDVRRSTISLLLRHDVYIGWCCEYLNLCDNNIWDISSSLSDVWSPALVSSSGWLRTDLMTRNHSWGVLELVVGWHGCDVRLDTITFVIPLLSPPTCNNGLGAVQPADITRIFERIFFGFKLNWFFE